MKSGDFSCEEKVEEAEKEKCCEQVGNSTSSCCFENEIEKFTLLDPSDLAHEVKVTEEGEEFWEKIDSLTSSSCIENEIGKVSLLDPSDLGHELKVEEEEKEVCYEKVGNLSSSCIGNEIDMVSLVEPLDLGHEVKVKEEVEYFEKVDDFTSGFCIEKVSLIDPSDLGHELKVGEEEYQKVENLTSSESETASSSSSSSSSSSESSSSEDDSEEEEEGEKKGEVEVIGEVEEGEIRDADEDDIVSWVNNDDDLDGEDDDIGGVKGPIMSKNEIKFLPPVPPVDVTLQPYHQILPVGVILSIIGTQVIVEGVEKHNPLNEGSILWITESRSPLGLIDEIFGPVKNPYYVVRYNSEDEIPAGIHEGTPVSFVPEFANHVLNDSNLYKKGYDASGENDEEISDEVEFSDDEKEAEYRRMLKTAKRGTNDQGLGNKKDRNKGKKRDGNWKNGQPSASRPPAGVGSVQPDQNQHYIPPVAASMDHGNCSCSSSTGQVFPGRPGLVSPFPQLAQATGFIPRPNGVWANGMPCQQPQSMVFPNGFPTDSMPWMQQNHQQHPYQMPLPNGMPFQQQQQFVVPGGQPNFFAGPTYAPWPGLIDQNGFNQTTFGMGLQGQHTHPTIGAGGPGILSNGLHMEQSCAGQPSAVNPGNIENSQQFNPGASFGRGRKPYRRGGGRFAGGRGRHQPK